jgi:hypothetical protein
MHHVFASDQARPQSVLLSRLGHQHRQSAKGFAASLARLTQESRLSWIVN